MGNFARATDSVLIGAMDNPAPDQSFERGVVHAWGWAFDPAGELREVLISVGGVQGRAELGLLRPDLALVHMDRPGIEMSGWVADVDLGDIQGDEAVISARARRGDGTMVLLGASTVRLRPPQPETPFLRVKGYVDSPGEGQLAAPGILPVWGWVIDETGPPIGVIVTIDGTPAELARLGVYRHDVVPGAKGVSESKGTGWEAEVRLPAQIGKKVSIGVIVLRHNGATYKLGTRTVRVGRQSASYLSRSRPAPGPERSRTGAKGEAPTPLARPEASIDYPARGATVNRGMLRMWGRALGGNRAAASIDLTVNGASVGAARLGMPRPDLVHHAAPDAVISGFEHLLDLSRLPSKTSSVVISGTARAMDGTTFALPRTRIDLEAVRRPRRPKTEIQRLELLRARFEKVAAGRNRTQTGGVNVLAFTHNLGYGGAQIFLLDLLRQLQELIPRFSCTVVSPSDGPLRDHHEKVGIPVHVTSGYHLTSAEQYEGHLLELASWAAPQPFNLVVVNTMLAFPGADLARRMGIPVLWAIHESYDLPVLWAEAYPPGYLQPYVRERAEAALREADMSVFEAHGTRELFVPYGSPDRLRTIHYGVDLEKIDRRRARLSRAAARRQLALPGDATVVLCVGTVEPRKAQTCLAQAFAAVSAKHPGAHLYFVGGLETEYSRTLEAYVKRVELADRITVVPLSPDTFTWYRAADLLVCASDVESLPKVVLEAMGFDLPVLATRVFGLGEILTDNETGYLCRSRDVAALSERLDEVLSMPAAERCAVGIAGGAVARRDHGPVLYAEKYAQLMDALVRRRPGALPRSEIRG